MIRIDLHDEGGANTNAPVALSTLCAVRLCWRMGAEMLHEDKWNLLHAAKSSCVVDACAKHAAIERDKRAAEERSLKFIDC